MSGANHTAGELSVRRANQPADGEYDYALAVESDGKWYVMAEAFGRVATDVRLPAAANAARLALCWNMHDELLAACKAMGARIIDTPSGMIAMVDDRPTRAARAAMLVAIARAEQEADAPPATPAAPAPHP